MWYEADDDVFVRYLLGGLSPLERDRFEDRYFADDVVHERLLAIEYELIDAYVRGDLSSDECRAFERQCSTTAEGRERVARARLLGTYAARAVAAAAPIFASQVGERPATDLPVAALLPQSDLRDPGRSPEATLPHQVVDRSSWWRELKSFIRLRPVVVRLVLAPVALLALVVVYVLLVHFGQRLPERDSDLARRKPQPVPIPQSHKQDLMSNTQGSHTEPTAPKQKEPVTLIATLKPLVQGGAASAATDVNVRGESQANTLNLSRTARQVELRVVLGKNLFPSYGATLRTVEGKEVLSFDRLHVSTGGEGSILLTLSFPSSILGVGDYTLQLTGTNEAGQVEDVAGYNFRCVSNDANAQVARQEKTFTKRTTAQSLNLPPKAEQLLQDPVNGKGDDFCRTAGGVFQRFPFSPRGSTDAALSDFNAVFQPGTGSLAMFYQNSLQDLVAGGPPFVRKAGAKVSVRPDFLIFLNRAMAISRAFFPSNATHPALSYFVQSTQSTNVDSFILQIGGKSLKGGGTSERQEFVWTGDGAAVTLTVKPGSGATPPAIIRSGVWALFQLLSDADRVSAGGTTYEYDIRGSSSIGGQATATGPLAVLRLQVEAKGAPGLFGSLPAACIGQVAQ